MKYFLTALVLATTSVVSAQKSTATDIVVKMAAAETVFIHANATAFVPGETLLYKLYCNTSYPDGLISKIGYVELVASDHNIIFSNKHYFKDGTADGDFFIKPSLATGNYKLIGYTNAILNNPARIFELDIKIINPFQVTGRTPTAQTSPASNTVQQTEFNLFGSTRSFKNRQQITLNLQSINDRYPDSRLSVSVRKRDDLGATSAISATAFSQIKRADAATSIRVLPEWRGELIEGSVAGVNSKVPIALSIPGKSFAFKVVNTDAAGNFRFNIDKEYPQQDVYVQVLGDGRETSSLTLNPRAVPSYDRLQIDEYFPGPELAAAISEHSVAAQIQNAYYTHKADTLAAAERHPLFYEPVARKFVLDEYTRFPTFAQTIIEVIEGAYFEQKNNQYSLFVRDNNLGRAITAPTLVLVDGLMLQDNADLFAYRASGIDHISTYSGVYLYGPSAFNGIISVVTKNQDFVPTAKAISKHEILRPVGKKKYFKQVHSVENQRVPDYRYQLLWLPDLNNTTTSFYASDVSGSFDVVIEGFSADGTPISVRDSFVVEK